GVGAVGGCDDAAAGVAGPRPPAGCPFADTGSGGHGLHLFATLLSAAERAGAGPLRPRAGWRTGAARGRRSRC
ncbi:hypothetical protein, partial [Mycobacterium avium]